MPNVQDRQPRHLSSTFFSFSIAVFGTWTHLLELVRLLHELLDDPGDQLEEPGPARLAHELGQEAVELGPRLWGRNSRGEGNNKV